MEGRRDRGKEEDVYHVCLSSNLNFLSLFTHSLPVAG